MAHSRRTTRLEDLFIDPTDAPSQPPAKLSPSGVDLEDVVVVIRSAPPPPPPPRHRQSQHGTTKSLTPDIVQQTGDFAHVICTPSSASSSLRATGPLVPFLRSYSVDCDRPPPIGSSTPTSASGDGGGGSSRLANGGGAGTMTTASASMDDHRLAVAYARSHGGNVRRWSQTLQRGALRTGKQTVREKTINCMPSRLNVTLDGDDGLDGTADGADGAEACGDGGAGGEVERLTYEIEQHEHLMDLTAQSEQQRM